MDGRQVEGKDIKPDDVINSNFSSFFFSPSLPPSLL